MTEDYLSSRDKVRLFLFGGVAVFLACIAVLGGFHLLPENTFYIYFQNASDIIEKSPVKISGVEVGYVKEVELSNGVARLKVRIRKEVRIYKNAKARVMAPGLLGSKFVDIIAGHPMPGASADGQLLHSGETIPSQEVISAAALMERFATTMNDIMRGNQLSNNYHAIKSNIQSIAGTIHAAFGSKKAVSTREIIRQISGFTEGAVSFTKNLNQKISDITKQAREFIQTLKNKSAVWKDILTKLNNGEGYFGNLLTNKQTGDDFRQNVSSMKDLSESAKVSLGQYEHVRAYWDLTARQDFTANVTRYDIGLRLDTDAQHFVYVAGENLASKSTQRYSSKDYERRNTATVLLGQRWGTFSGALGAIRSRPGVQVRYIPFQDPHIPILSRLELMAEGYDFERDDVINGRYLNKPDIVTGLRVHLTPNISAGVQAEDLAETTDWEGVFNISFEDKEIDKILGFSNFSKTTVRE